MSTQLELDLEGLAAIATSRIAAAAIVDGRRPGTSRLVARNGTIQREPVGFGVALRTLEKNRIPLHPWLTPELAQQELEQHEHELTSDGWED